VSFCYRDIKLGLAIVVPCCTVVYADKMVGMGQLVSGLGHPGIMDVFPQFIQMGMSEALGMKQTDVFKDSILAGT
jgi:hypothetical protein